MCKQDGKLQVKKVLAQLNNPVVKSVKSGQAGPSEPTVPQLEGGDSEWNLSLLLAPSGALVFIMG